MIDALLLAIRDDIRKAGFGYDSPASCEIMDDGKPPPRAGNVFVAVHEGQVRSTNDNCLMEYYDWNITLTMRVAVPLDRVGDQLLASKLARKHGPGQPSFNARLEQLRAFLHVNWRIGLYNANANLIEMAPPGIISVYGFIEPARYRSMEKPVLVGPDWFSATPESGHVGLKSELRFEGARRMQALTPDEKIPLEPFPFV
jgi:hypothetical protein